MRRRTGLLLLAAVIAAAALAGGLLLTMGSDSATSASSGIAPMQGNSSVAKAKAFTKFPLYYAGNTVRGLPLTAVEDATTYETDPANTVTFLYGDCEPSRNPDGTFNGGCPPPVQVQVWNACARNPASYTQSMLSPVADKITVRGVPAARFEGGDRMEIQTGRSTVVIFAEKAETIAPDLRGLNNNVPDHVDLPAPAAGAMTGKIGC